MSYIAAATGRSGCGRYGGEDGSHWGIQREDDVATLGWDRRAVTLIDRPCPPPSRVGASEVVRQAYAQDCGLGRWRWRLRTADGLKREMAASSALSRRDRGRDGVRDNGGASGLLARRNRQVEDSVGGWERPVGPRWSELGCMICWIEGRVGRWRSSIIVEQRTT